jgi:hypothetical protein
LKRNSVLKCAIICFTLVRFLIFSHAERKWSNRSRSCMAYRSGSTLLMRLLAFPQNRRKALESTCAAEKLRILTWMWLDQLNIHMAVFLKLEDTGRGRHPKTQCGQALYVICTFYAVPAPGKLYYVFLTYSVYSLSYIQL